MDMDGVLWRGGEALPGLHAFIAFLKQQGIPFVMATNNSSKTPLDYVEKLAGLGVPDIAAEQIITSSGATAMVMRDRYPAGTPVYVVGMAGLRDALQGAGFTLVEEGASVVVVGIDFDLNYAIMRQAALLIRAGADFIGTNPDRTFPSPAGLVPGAGSLLAMLEAATDTTPFVIGKPHAAMFEVALARLGLDAAHTLMIGDRLDTDIQGAQALGLRTALVLTGVTHAEQARSSAIQADAVFTDLPHLQQQWQALLAE